MVKKSKVQIYPQKYNTFSLLEFYGRGTLQRLIELGQSQQQELIQRQQQLKQAHDHLVENSKTILAAQVHFFFSFLNILITFFFRQF